MSKYKVIELRIFTETELSIQEKFKPLMDEKIISFLMKISNLNLVDSENQFGMVLTCKIFQVLHYNYETLTT